MTNKITGITFDLSDMHLHGSAFYEFLGLRKRFFVDTLAWDIPHNNDVEMDQYDNPTAAYSVAMMNGRLVGGARLMRFSDKWGSHGCMLQDAAEGRIDGIPADLLPRAHRFANSSECTRLVLSDQLTSQDDRQEALGLVVQGLVTLAIDQGSADLVTLTVPGFRRSLRKLGYDVEQVGEKYRNKHDGRSYAILSMPAVHAAATAPLRQQANV
ncbi:MAG TPA: acyl-homoserine-lactone synthase [Roseovarius sp.]